MTSGAPTMDAAVPQAPAQRGLRRLPGWRWPASWPAPWPAHGHWRRPGLVPLAIGALALLPAAALIWAFQPRWQDEAQAARQALQRRSAQMAAIPRPAEPPPAAQRLRDALPGAERAPQRLADLLDLARQHGLTVASVQQAAVLRGDGIDSQPLTWHASGRYASLRAFVAEALQADAALVLDQLRLSRGDARAATLEADLQWQLLQRGVADARGSMAAPPSPPTARARP